MKTNLFLCNLKHSTDHLLKLRISECLAHFNFVHQQYENICIKIIGHQRKIRDSILLQYSIIERLDPSHPYPLGERRDKHVTVRGRTSDLLRRGANLWPPAPQAAALPKELSRQLIRRLFGTSTWLPSACGVTHGLIWRQLVAHMLLLPE